MRKYLTRIIIGAAVIAAALAFAHTHTYAAGDASKPKHTLINPRFTLEVADSKAFGAVLMLREAADGIKSFKLTGPDRFVVDITGAVMDGTQNSLEVGSDSVSRLRVAQFSARPDIIRVAIELSRPATLTARMEGNVVHIEETGYTAAPTTALKGAKTFPEPTVKKLADRLSVGFGVALPDGVTPQALSNPFRIVLDIPGYVPKESLKTYPVNSGVVESVKVSYFNNNPVTTRVIVNCKLFASYKIDKTASGFTVSVVQPSLIGKTIVVDPGHGGKDAGAIATDGTHEKDLNLDISLKLRDLLEAAGARVIMTRGSDVFIPLGDRAYIANRENADVFVSVHNNALEKHYLYPSKRGTQTYYHADGSRELASVIHKNMLASLGDGDMGMRSARYKVLRESRMKAVLCEVAYVTHASDNVLLNSNEFRENAARGIFNGLNEFYGGRTALQPPLQLPAHVLAYLPGPSPASRFVSYNPELDDETYPADPGGLDDGVEVVEIEPANAQDKGGAYDGAAPGASVYKSGPSRLNQQR